ncbi:nicotinate-nucleotide--dimethylbenzimidazole phosphoribosyltransferase [Pseudoalteromonas sp. G4]|uniref:nicotinate-nucleotide--dimethylbenzimidazole phosphoribosyltransferase n=1 Tax=Pseudoalteromonas sp. G4 TaxID=2992761 RepID=UPI00237EDDF2|nr:nicotinate-nucleotide--dimethylbenzimidazole phosphoribosyltransferase [Pseudoalteromonas sp. G4]MDE3270678.1 nicotinate-nucleotide--dimethylbenzimidazole phosphoribosyltransferase [Pseudoalteromonas sp. G4]
MSTGIDLTQLIQNTINGKIKPLGSLGKIESLAAQIAGVQITEPSHNKLHLQNPSLLIFAGDHGIAKHNVSIAPSDVTSLMVNCFINDQAAINSFIKDTDWQLHVIDCGIQVELPANNKLINARLGNCCGDISEVPALSDSQFQQAQINAEQIITNLNTNIIGFGEMGIANTSPASAIFAKLFGLSANDIVGVGTGINNDQLAIKRSLIDKAISRIDSTEPKNILRELGSFEIATMAFAMLTAFKKNKLIIVDGFIVTAAAAIALAIEPKIKSHLIFAHVSNESAHKQVLARLKVEPLLDLSLRLGEGTGAALSLPLIQAAVNFYNHMASFDDLGISL